MQTVIPPSGSSEEFSMEEDSKKRLHVRWTPEMLKTLVFAYRVMKSAARNQSHIKAMRTWARVANVVMAVHDAPALSAQKCKKRFTRLEAEYQAFCDLAATAGFQLSDKYELVATEETWQRLLEGADAKLATVVRKYRRNGFPLYKDMQEAGDALPSVPETDMKDEEKVKELLASAVSSRLGGPVDHGGQSASVASSPLAFSPSSDNSASGAVRNAVRQPCRSTSDITLGAAAVPGQQYHMQAHQVPTGSDMATAQQQLNLGLGDLPGSLSLSGPLAELLSGGDALQQSGSDGSSGSLPGAFAAVPPISQEESLLRLVNHVLDLTAPAGCDIPSLMHSVAEERVAVVKSIYERSGPDALLLRVVETQLSRISRPEESFQVLSEFLRIEMPYTKHLRRLFPSRQDACSDGGSPDVIMSPVPNQDMSSQPHTPPSAQPPQAQAAPVGAQQVAHQLHASQLQQRLAEQHRFEAQQRLARHVDSMQRAGRKRSASEIDWGLQRP